MASPIPVRNIYYLLCYAWNRLEEGGLVDVSRLDSTELADLYAAVLLSGVHHLMRRGLDQGYTERIEEIAGVRGRMDVGVTVRRMLAMHGRSLCRYDDLRVDTLPNRILKSTVGLLTRSRDLDPGLRKELVGLRRDLGGITDIQLRKSDFRRIQLHQNNRAYLFLLSVCELILDSVTIDEAAGTTRFRDFVRDEKKMAKLFEDFVFNFYSKERPDLKIARDRIRWAAESVNDANLEYLPSMNTDISIRNDRKTLVVDTKYYAQTFQVFYDRRRVHSANLYQLYAYLKNLESREGPDSVADGMLIYPVVQEHVSLNYSVPGHDIHIRTVDLRQDWRDLRHELLGFLDVLG